MNLRNVTQAYIYALLQATRALYRNWFIVPGSILAFLTYQLISELMRPFGIVGGFVVGMVSIVLLSVYYLWLESAVDQQRIRLQNALVFDYVLFSSTMSVAFVLYLLLYFSQLLAPPDILPFISLGLFVAFNCIPEVIYSERYESIAAFRKALDFVQAHPLEWFLPHLLLFVPVIVWYGAGSLVLMMIGAQPLLPVLLMVTQLQIVIHHPVLGPLCGVLIGTWFMLFRGFLFRKLDRVNVFR